MTRRLSRDRTVDIACVVLSVAGGVLGLVLELNDLADPLTPTAVRIDVALGAVACVAVWFRRRWPVGVAVVMLVPMALSSASAVAAIIAMITVAVHRRASVALAVAVLQVGASCVYFLLRPAPEVNFRTASLFALLTTAALVAWGMYIRARRQLIASLRERAERAEDDQQLHAEQARHAERARIAGEMHDVLGHRMSLIALQAGGLEVGTGLTPDEMARTAGLIRATAHQALVDLRDVVGVLREDAGDLVPQAPQPTLRDIARLVEESRHAGADVRLEMRVEEPETAPGSLGRAAYRIVQEALTNVHKHASGAATTVLLHGGPKLGLQVRVRNRLPRDGGATPSWPGGGRGLIGLAERVALAGGTLTHGRDPTGDFVVDAQLRWER